jgi:excisionase family DNA binding protein
MAKYVRTSSLSSARPYAVNEICTLLGVARPQVERWLADGLPVVHSGKPRLVRGRDLKDFLASAQSSKKPKLPFGAFQCMHCKAPRQPLYGMLDFTPYASNSGRLSGLCEVCEHPISAFCASRDLGRLQKAFDVTVTARSRN